MLTSGMPLYRIEINSHFTFLQGGINGGIIIINDKNLSERYLVNKKTNQETGVISGVAAPFCSYSSVLPIDHNED